MEAMQGGARRHTIGGAASFSGAISRAEMRGEGLSPRGEGPGPRLSLAAASLGGAGGVGGGAYEAHHKEMEAQLLASQALQKKTHARFEAMQAEMEQERAQLRAEVRDRRQIQPRAISPPPRSPLRSRHNLPRDRCALCNNNWWRVRGARGSKLRRRRRRRLSCRRRGRRRAGCGRRRRSVASRGRGARQRTKRTTLRCNR